MIPTTDYNYSRGSNAAMRKQPRTDNPFKQGSAAFNAWNEGWDSWNNIDWDARRRECREQLAAGNWQSWVEESHNKEAV